MSGYIIVTSTPYFAKTDISGNFNIDHVPDGSYTITAWHEGYRNQSKPVDRCGRRDSRFFADEVNGRRKEMGSRCIPASNRQERDEKRNG
jgi:hypothetical protein